MSDDDQNMTAAKLVVASLQRRAEQRVNDRAPIEQRWLEDLRQFHARYDEDIWRKLNRSFGGSHGASNTLSKININQTRIKTLTMASKLSDLLFPTDESNWAIDPTPIPELSRAASEASSKSLEAELEARRAAVAASEGEGGPEAAELAQENDRATQAAMLAEEKEKLLQGEIEFAEKAAKAMSDEVADVLVESNYSREARKVIEDACKIGAGVVEGPILDGRGRKRWVKGEDGYSLEAVGGDKPKLRRIDPWSFFPDLTVQTVDEGDGVFIRHMLNEKGIRRLSKSGDFNKTALRELLQEKPVAKLPTHIAALSEITGKTPAKPASQYTVWQYTGTLSAEEMADLAKEMGDEDTAAEAMNEPDPLAEMHCVVWFCQGRVLKFGIYPLDSGEPLYSVFSLQEDETTPFGYGIPRLIRDPQQAMASAARMLMDNAGISSGPQIFMDRKAVKPANGSFEITPRKLWFVTDDLREGKATTPISAVNIPSMQAELVNIIQVCKQWIDDMSGIPTLMQGDQGTQPVQTATGMTLLMNSGNIVFRNHVKKFDDAITVPVITRIYDWLMQFSDKDHIKGDYAVKARGSSALMQRETEGQNLLILAERLGGHPIYGPMIKHASMLRKAVSAHKIDADEVIKSDDEMTRDAETIGPDPAIAAVEQEIADKQAERETRVAIENMNNERAVAVAQLEHEKAMMELSAKYELTMEQVAAKLNEISMKSTAQIEAAKIKEEGANRRLAFEGAMTEIVGPGGGGHL